MANPSKQKGTAAETRVVKFLRAAGIESARQPLSGNKDIGDIWYLSIPNPLWLAAKKEILEVKAGKQTDGYSRTDKNIWLKQTQVEGEHANTAAYLVIARHGRAVKDYEVWSHDGHNFWYLDDFVKAIGGKLTEK